MRRNPLTLLMAGIVVLVALSRTQDGTVAEVAGWAVFVANTVLAVLCTRDLRRHGVDNAWVVGLLVWFLPFIGFVAYVLVRRSARKAAAAR